MKKFLYTGLFFCFFINISSAQIFFLDGPSQLCIGECGTWTFVGGDPNCEYQWDGGDGNTSLGGPSFTNCYTSPGTYLITAFSFCDSIFLETELLVSDGFIPDIISTSITNCPDNDLPTACEKVCANSTVTYTVPNGSSQALEWNVVGAESYTEDGEFITVTWGTPGAGYISVSAGGGGGPGNSNLQVQCESLESTLNDDDGTAWASAYGGVLPYTYLWSDGSTTPLISGLLSGTYVVIVTDASGASVTCTTVVEESFCEFPYFTDPIITPASDCQACDGNISPNIEGGSGSYEFIWSTGQTGPIADGLCPGVYNVEIVDLQFDCFFDQTYIIFCPDSLTSFCSGEAELCIDIIPDPEAIAVSDPPASMSGNIEICQGQTIYFDNQSTDAESYIWNSGDGQLSTNQDPSFTYENGGTYQLMLVAKNECLCSDTTFYTIDVENTSGPAINCIGTVCTGEEVTYTTDAMGCASYFWTVSTDGQITDGGTTNDDFVTIIWTSGSAGTIELAVDGCGAAFCQQATIEEVPIISNDAEIEGPSIVCRGDVEIYSIQHWNGMEYNWSVSTYGEIKSGQNSNEIVVKWDLGFIPTDQQWVAVDYENCYLDCSGSDTHTVDILPEYFIAGPIEACQNSNSQYQSINVITNGAVMSNWTVTAPDGSIVWTSAGAQATANISWPAATGIYQIETTPNNPTDFCFDNYSVFVKIVEAPPAPMGITGTDLVCPGQAYNYDVVSLQPDNGFEWTINDGGIISYASGASINHSWGINPPYQLSVVEIATDGLACVSDPTTFSATPITTLTMTGVNELCAEESGMYTATYYDEVDYEWEIIPSDAGTILEGLNTEVIEILWHVGGAATVQVTMCGIVETFPVTVNSLPVPVANHPVGLCIGETATISTTIPYVSYDWKNENGGSISASATPDLGPGVYELEVIDANGCQDNTTFSIIGYALPSVSISSPDNTAFCPGDPSPTIYALNTEDGYTYQWFRDNSPITNTTTSLTTAIYGVYHIVVTNQNGCTAQSNNLELVEYCGPTGGGTCTGENCPIPPCLIGNPTFDLIPSGVCNIKNYENTTTIYVPGSAVWDFGDPDSGLNNTSNLDDPQHTFSYAGFFVVQLNVDKPNGDNCYLAQVDTVPVAADFEIRNACEDDPTQFLDISTFLEQPFANITAYDWNFGDPVSGANNTSTDQDPTHVYADGGFYSVTLVVTDQSGCTSSMTRNIEVYEKPVGTFPTPSINCERTPLEFNAVVSADVIDILWDFGDLASGNANESTEQTTYHAYDTPGNYTVSLTTYNVYGCPEVFTNTVTIDPNPLMGPIDYISPICEGVTTTLTAPTGGVSWEWSTMETTESIDVSEAGVYSLTMTDNMGCIYIPPSAVLDIIPAPDATILAIEFNEFGQPVGNFFDGYITCEGEDVFLQIIGSSAYSYDWSSGGGSTQQVFDEEHSNQLSVGDHDFTVTVTDNASGCTSVSGPFTVTINPLPTNVTISANPSPTCENEVTTISVNSPQTDYTYYWSNGEIGTSITTSLAGIYSVTAVTPFGCRGESNELEIFAAPDISKVPDGCHTRCDPDEICLPTIPGVVSYQWYLNDVLIPAPEGTIANYIATESGNYQVVLTDANGCTDISSGLDLTIIPLDTMTVNLEACTGEFADYEGNMIAAGDTEEYVYQNIFGCDSTITVNVLERPIFNELINLSGCEGSTVSYNGVDYLAGTQIQLMYTTQYGCDSIIDLVIDEVPVDTTYLTLTACDGGTVEYEGNELVAGDVLWTNLTSFYNCDSVVSVTVDAFPIFNFDLESGTEPICWNANEGNIVVSNISGGTDPYVYSLDGVNYQASDTLIGLTPGDYIVYIQDDNGCVQEDEVNIPTIEAINVQIPDPVLPCEADSIVLQPFLVNNFADSVSWVWQDGSIDETFSVFNPGQYSLVLSNECEDLTKIFDVKLTPDGRENFIYIPNAFSPNHDGINDVFQGLSSPEVTVIEWEMYVFDRWGATLFHSTEFTEGWDGIFKNEELNPGVYVWWYKAKIRTCHRNLDLAQEGDITILK